MGRPNLYLQLDYDDYKSIEDQLRRFEELETSHITVSGYYHKAFRLDLGAFVIEFQGPLVKQPQYEEHGHRLPDMSLVRPLWEELSIAVQATVVEAYESLGYGTKQEIRRMLDGATSKDQKNR